MSLKKPLKNQKSIFRFAPLVTTILFLGPILAGLSGTLFPAFGFIPDIGEESISLAPWKELIAIPGIVDSIQLSFFTGVITTAISLTVVIIFFAGWQNTKLFFYAQRFLSPLLSVPHVTIALGLAFLLTPSGWIVRLISPWATGFIRPPDIIILQDAEGLSLIFGLVIKEIPFLFLMTMAAINQVNVKANCNIARTLGYRPVMAWLKTVLPLIYPQIRLPIFAVIAYSSSTVDVAMVLGPTTPPTLAVQLVKWFYDPDINMHYIASAGALVQLLIVIIAIIFWRFCEFILFNLGNKTLNKGSRGRSDAHFRIFAAIALLTGFCFALLSLLGMALWSLTISWRFPSSFPESLSISTWIGRIIQLESAFLNTLSVGLLSTFISLIIVISCLESEANSEHKVSNRFRLLIYLPLLVPQIAFLFGTQIFFIIMGVDGSWLAVAFCHFIFVLPYVFLSLEETYRSLDDRYRRIAICLGSSYFKFMLRIKLPLLLKPILIAFAVGFAVSVSLYLPTLFAGAGRFETLTTEAVSLAASGNRRIIGTYALMQMLLPFIAFLLATNITKLIYGQQYKKTTFNDQP